MIQFLLRLFLGWALTMFALLGAIYALVFFGAGDPIKLIFLRAPGGIAYDPVRIEAMRATAGLDRPFHEQFWNYVTQLLQGNFGNSLIGGRPVLSIIAEAAPATLQLGLAAFVLTILIGVPLGMISATKEGSWLDTLISSLSLSLWAVPPYVLGPLLMMAFIVLFPSAGVPLGWGGLLDGRAILPVAVLALQPIALIQRQTRAAVTEVLTEDFVRTARAKGLSNMTVLLRHVLRPALTPIVTQLGLILITLINGAIFVEVVFSVPGLGRLTVRSLVDSDYPVILALAMIGTAAVLISNLLVEVAYPLLDPRASIRR